MRNQTKILLFIILIINPLIISNNIELSASESEHIDDWGDFMYTSSFGNNSIYADWKADGTDPVSVYLLNQEQFLYFKNSSILYIISILFHIKLR